MTEPTQEQLRTEAYWRSTIARELYDRADQMERESWSKTASIVRDAGDKVGQMPDRTPRVFDREPSADVVVVWDKSGDAWDRTDDGWVCFFGDPLDFPTLRDTWGPITARPTGGA
jgi:hypothetical protein